MLRTMDELKAFFAGDAFAMDTCGIVIDSVSEQGAVCSMAIEPKHLNAGGVVQGGAIFTLVDFTFAVAANAQGGLCVSQNASISYIKPGTGKALRTEASVISSGRTVCVYSVRVLNAAGELIACATVTGMRKQA